MYIFEIVTWLLFGFAIAMLHISFVNHRPIPAVAAGMGGALAGGFIARIFGLTPFVVLGYSMTALVGAGICAEAFILLAKKRSRPEDGGHQRVGQW